MLPKYDNILMNGQYFDCGNGQVMLNTGSNKFGSTGGGGAKVLKPYALRWQRTSKTNKDEGEWQIYLPMGCATLDKETIYITKNENGKNIEGDEIFQWYKIKDPVDQDASVKTINGYTYKEWTVYVHFKDFPIFYASTIQDDNDFKGDTQRIPVGSLLLKEWNKDGKNFQSRKTTQFVDYLINRDVENVSQFKIIYVCEGDKTKEASYKMKLTNQFITYGVREQKWIEKDTDITNKEEVILKIEHGTEDIKLSIVDDLEDNSDDVTFIRILKLEEKGITFDNRQEARKVWPFYAK